jgi:hypothetical protein
MMRAAVGAGLRRGDSAEPHCRNGQGLSASDKPVHWDVFVDDVGDADSVLIETGRAEADGRYSR